MNILFIRGNMPTLVCLYFKKIDLSSGLSNGGFEQLCQFWSFMVATIQATIGGTHIRGGTHKSQIMLTFRNYHLFYTQENVVCTCIFLSTQVLESMTQKLEVVFQMFGPKTPKLVTLSGWSVGHLERK